MSPKRLYAENRLRYITVGFRMTPEDNEDLNRRVRLSGFTKQDYITHRLQEREIIVQGNPRVYKALKGQMELIYRELLRLQTGNEVSVKLQETICLVAKTLGGMNYSEGERKDI